MRNLNKRAASQKHIQLVFNIPCQMPQTSDYDLLTLQEPKLSPLEDACRMNGSALQTLEPNGCSKINHRHCSQILLAICWTQHSCLWRASIYRRREPTIGLRGETPDERKDVEGGRTSFRNLLVNQASGPSATCAYRTILGALQIIIANDVTSGTS
jgi:hypothetical protein